MKRKHLDTDAVKRHREKMAKECPRLSGARREAWSRPSSAASRGSVAPLTPWPSHAASGTVSQYISVVLSHPFRYSLLQQSQEANAVMMTRR